MGLQSSRCVTSFGGCSYHNEVSMNYQLVKFRKSKQMGLIMQNLWKISNNVVSVDWVMLYSN